VKPLAPLLPRRVPGRRQGDLDRPPHVVRTYPHSWVMNRDPSPSRVAPLSRTPSERSPLSPTRTQRVFSVSRPVLAVSQTCTIPHRATWRSWVLDQAAPARPLPESCHARRFSLLPDRSRNREERPRRETERPGPRSLGATRERPRASGRGPHDPRPRARAVPALSATPPCGHHLILN